jgi:hypothetical protein
VLHDPRLLVIRLFDQEAVVRYGILGGKKKREEQSVSGEEKSVSGRK